MSIKLSILFEGLKEAISGFRKAAAGAYQARVNKVIGRQAEKAAEEMRKNAPKRTGALQRSIEAKQVSLMNWQITESAKSPYGVSYGAIQRTGARGNYMIFPRFKQALYWPGLGHPISWVGEPWTQRHPGFKAQNYAEKGLKKITSRQAEINREVGEEIIAEITGKGKSTK